MKKPGNIIIKRNQAEISNQGQPSSPCRIRNSQYFGSKTQNLSKQVLVVKQSNLEDYISKWVWRAKTGFPIAKLLCHKIVSRESVTGEVHIKVGYQKYPMTLPELGPRPLHQLLYVLKQCLIGFQRLINKYGYFIIRPEMIFFNRYGKCKVWISKFVWQQETEKPSIGQDNDAYCLSLLSTIIWNKCIKDSMARNFFQKYNKVTTFPEAVLFITAFAAKYGMNDVDAIDFAGRRTSPSKMSPKKMLSGCGSPRNINFQLRTTFSANYLSSSPCSPKGYPSNKTLKIKKLTANQSQATSPTDEAPSSPCNRTSQALKYFPKTVKKSALNIKKYLGIKECDEQNHEIPKKYNPFKNLGLNVYNSNTFIEENKQKTQKEQEDKYVSQDWITNLDDYFCRGDLQSSQIIGKDVRYDNCMIQLPKLRKMGRSITDSVDLTDQCKRQ